MGSDGRHGLVGTDGRHGLVVDESGQLVLNIPSAIVVFKAGSFGAGDCPNMLLNTDVQ